jgi:hypothetical protein
MEGNTVTLCHMSQPTPQPTTYQFAPVVTRPTSGLAVAGFIASLLWVFGVGSIAGIILCALAWQKTKTGERGGHGLAIAGIIIGVLGLVGFAILFAATIAAIPPA